MGRIDEQFKKLKQMGRKALITFVTAGDPDLSATVELVKEMERQGADLIELGIPYSDPIAEGPVIQAANARALKNPVKIQHMMETVRTIRQTVQVPLLYLLYCNCILQYGPDRFFSDCAAVGVDGVIIPDLPFEEKGELEPFADKHGVIIISLISPTSGDRIKTIASKAKGFLYCVSSLGVTGMRSGFSTDFDAFFSAIHQASDIPKAIGFGISAPEHAAQLKGYCDGLIIGSAVVRQVERAATPEEAITNVGRYVADMRRAMDA